MIKKKGFGLLLALIVCFSACSKKNNEKANIVKFNLGSDPFTLDPRMARDPHSQMLTKLFFDGLTRIGPLNVPELSVAKECEISEDCKTYTFILRDCNWSNGDPVLASDFVYAWKTLVSPGSTSDQSYQLDLIKNARKIRLGGADLEELGVHAVGDKTLVVELEYSVPYFFELLAAPYFYPIHEETDRKCPGWAEKPSTYVSNGPFIFSTWDHHKKISASSSKNYWDKNAVGLDGIEFFMVDSDVELSLFEKGELHWTGSPIGVLPTDALESLKRTSKVHTLPRAETAFLRLNVKKEGLSCEKARRALASAIDRKSIVEHILQSGQLPAQSYLPPSLKCSEDIYFEDGDIEAARNLFIEAEEADPDIRTVFSSKNLTLSYIQSDRTHLIAQAIQEQFREAFNFKINLEGLERKVFLEKIRHGDYQIAFCSWGADFHDPVNFLEVFKHSEQSTNNTGWHSDKYSSLLEISNQKCKLDERKKIFSNCEKILMKEMPIIPIFFYSMSYIKDEKLKDVVFSTLGSLDFKWANFQSEVK